MQHQHHTLYSGIEMDDKGLRQYVMLLLAKLYIIWGSGKPKNKYRKAFKNNEIVQFYIQFIDSSSFSVKDLIISFSLYVFECIAGSTGKLESDFSFYIFQCINIKKW